MDPQSRKEDVVAGHCGENSGLMMLCRLHGAHAGLSDGSPDSACMSHRTHQSTKLAEQSPLHLEGLLEGTHATKCQEVRCLSGTVWAVFGNDGMARLLVPSTVSQTRVQAHTVATLKLMRLRNIGQDSKIYPV